MEIVTRTPGVVFTGVLALNNGPRCKLFEGGPLRALPGTDLSEVLHCPPTASLPCIWDIRQIVKSARDILESANSETVIKHLLYKTKVSFAATLCLQQIDAEKAPRS